MNNQKEKIVGISKIKESWKNYNVEIIQVKLENGNITGTFEGVEKMTQSNKKITNQDIINLIVDMKKDMNKRFEDIDKRFEDIDKRFEDMNKDIVDMKKDMNKRFDKMDAKIDLMIQTPTMNKEIDHEALAKIDAR